MRNSVVTILLLLASGGAAFAQRSATATLHVNAEIQGSVSIEFITDSNREPIVATGAGSASFVVPTFGGSFSRQSTPAASGDTTFLISSPFTIRVLKANLPSASYSLRAALSISDPEHAWTIDGIGISHDREQVVSAAEPYNFSNSHALTVSGPASAQNWANAIRFVVIVN